MKKIYLIVSLFLLLSLAACQSVFGAGSSSENSAGLPNGNADCAPGYSLTQAGIELIIPRDQIKSFPFLEDELFRRYAGYYGTALGKSFLTFQPNMTLADSVLAGYGHLLFEGTVTELEFKWEDPGELDFFGNGICVYAHLGIFQAYKKSDLESGQVIRLDLYCAHESKSGAQEKPEGAFVLLIGKDNVQTSPYLVGETGDYYIFDWLDFMVDDYRTYLYANVLRSDKRTDGYGAEKIDLNMYLLKMPLIREEVRQLTRFEEIE